MKKDESLAVAVAQYEVSDISREKNMKTIEGIALDISKTSEKLPDVLVFPELAVEGYAFGENEWREYAADNDVKGFFATLARKFSINIIAGFAERAEKSWYDAAGCFSPDGKIEIYRKIHLWSSEKDFFRPGNSVCFFEVFGWKIAPQICADVGFPELSRRQVLDGAELLVVTAAWSNPYGYMWRNCCLARATENLVGLAASNRVGEFVKGGSFCGESLAVSPRGEEMLRLRTEKGWFMEIFSKADMNKWRHDVPWLDMRKPEIYGI